MDTFWILVLAMIAVLMTMMVRLMLMRRRYRRSGMQFRRNTVGKSYFDRNKSCHAYTLQLLSKLTPGAALAAVRIPCEGGELNGIVLAHATGVYVFEIKEYGGSLNGEADFEFWTLHFENGRMETLLNPLRQGRGYIRMLEELLGIPENLFYLYIVFGQRCKLMQVPNPAGNIALATRTNLKPMLEKDFSERPEALSTEQMYDILEKLKAYELKK